jgi:hypothetical protein
MHFSPVLRQERVPLPQGLGPLNGRSLSGGPSLPPLALPPISAAGSAYQYSRPAQRKVTEYEAGWVSGLR